MSPLSGKAPGYNVTKWLPFPVAECLLTGSIVTMRGLLEGGQAWSLLITNAWSYSSSHTAVSWGDSPDLLEMVADTIRGDKIISLEGPPDLFDATLRFESGAVLRQLSTDEDAEAWFFHLPSKYGYVGPGPAEHRRWIASLRGRPE